jgi:hypothetical protein
MKFNRLSIEQVTKLWDDIRQGVMRTISPAVQPTAENMRAILCQILRDDMQCWCFFTDADDRHGYVVTSIIRDPNTNEKTLVIYSLFLYKHINELEVWDKGIDSINKFARANNCKTLVAWSDNDNAISIAKKLGFTSDYTYLTKEVN